MQRIQDSTASATLPSPPALSGPIGYFTEGSPGVTPPTNVRAWILNVIQEELLAILSFAGITPDTTGTSTNQVLTAIQHIITAAGPSWLAVPGYKKIPDPNSPSGFFIIQWGTATVAAPTAVTFLLAFSTACLGVVVSESNANAGTWSIGNPTVHGRENPTVNGYTGWALTWSAGSWIAGSLGQAYIAVGY
jgi:hypothetical protein